MTGRDLSDSMLILPLVRCKCDHVQWAGTSGRSRKTVVPVHKGASLSSILRSKVCCEYGGYLTPGSIRALWYRTPRALVNDSKLNLPLYLPIPELPTPPKGISGNIGVIMHSLMHASPDSVASRMRSATLRSSANTYRPSGGGWLLIDWMTASIESTSITGRIGPNTSSCMIGESGDGSTSTVGAI